MSIEFQKVSYTYSQGTPFAHQSLTDINLTVKAGEWVVVMGPTGSGKSTLVQHINGLLKPTCGKVLVNNQDIHSSLSYLKKTREKVGLVFQYPEHQIFGSTVFEEISYGPDNFGCPKDEIDKKVRYAMNIVGLDYEKYKDRSPHELSGGEKRRVALAGVLASEPDIIALDEPTAGLDQAGKKVLIETILELNRKLGITVIWVTHEITEISLFADRLIVLNRGQIVLDGTVRETLASPLIEDLGLDIPMAVEVANYLKKRGEIIEALPLTLEEIENEILRLMR